MYSYITAPGKEGGGGRAPLAPLAPLHGLYRDVLLDRLWFLTSLS